MADPTPNRCPSAEGQSCKHGHAFTTGCLLPSEQNVPACCREDLVFDEQRQAVTIVRTDAAARFAEWKARNVGVRAVDSRHCGNCADGVPGGPDNCSKCGRAGTQYSHWTPAAAPRFQKTSCSQCGGEFGPGDQGYSHCVDHQGGKP